MTQQQEILEKIEQDPLSLKAWALLQNERLEANDFLSVKSLSVILYGLAELEEQKSNPKTLLRLNNGQRRTFVRLSQSCNNPSLLKEIGLLYLKEFQLPAAAKKHLELAHAFSPLTDELQALLAQAEKAIESQEEPSLQGCGVTEAQHVKPVVGQLVRKTGKLAFSEKNRKDFSSSDIHKELSKAPLPCDALLEKKELLAQEENPETLAEKTWLILPDGQKKSLSEILTQMKRYVDDLAFEQAEKLCTFICEKVSHSILQWSARTILGYQYFIAARYDLAAIAFEKACSLAPDSMNSWFNLALAQQNQGEIHAALKNYMQADKLEPNNPKIWCSLSALYFQTDLIDEAEQAARRSLTLDPDYARAWDNLATALAAQEHLQEAKQACHKAIELNPAYLEPWLKLGMIYFQEDHLEESEKALTQAKTLTSTSAYALTYLAIIHCRFGRLDQAVDFITQANKIDSECAISWICWNEIGLAYYHQNQWEEALQAFGQSTKHNPQAFESWFNYGLAFEQKGHEEEAQRCYHEAVTRDRTVGVAWHRLGSVATKLKDDFTAARAFKTLVELEPENVQAWSHFADALTALGENEEAEKARAQANHLTTSQKNKKSNLQRAIHFLWSNT